MTTPETSPASEEADRTTSGSSVAQMVKALAALTVLGVVGGGFLGLTLGTGASIETVERTQAASGKQGGSLEQGHAGGNKLAASELVVKEMPPIITNLAIPETTWVRLQAAIVYDAKTVANSELLVTELMSDIVVFLRTVSLASIEGADGLRSLHEDLSERATIRSEGLVREFIIQSLVVQ